MIHDPYYLNGKLSAPEKGAPHREIVRGDRPCVKYEDFEVTKYTDYGKIRHDKREETRVAQDATPPKKRNR